VPVKETVLFVALNCGIPLMRANQLLDDAATLKR